MKPKYLFFLILLFGIGFAQDTKENADFKLAMNLYNDKLYDLALEQFKTFINLYPNAMQGIEARFYLGLTQSRLGKHEDARITFQNFALSYPDNIKAPEAWMNVAEEFLATNNEREAAMAFERVKTFHPKSKYAPTALLKAAQYYELLKDTTNTLRTLRVLTQEYTTAEVLPGRLKLAEILISAGQYEEARQECKRVIDAANDASLKARGLLLQGKALIAMGKSNEAVASLSDIRKNFKSTSSYYDALFSLGSIRNAVGDVDEAMSAWKLIVEDKTKASQQLQQDALIEMADASNRSGSYKNSLSLFERASGIRGNRNGEALYKAGVAAERAGDLNKAIQHYSRALADSIGYADRRALIIGAFKAARVTKNYMEAVSLANQYRQQYPSDRNLPRLLVEGADVATNGLNDPKTAVDFCEWLLTHFPSSEWVDDATFALGEARRKSGDIDGAIAEFENLERRYPSSEFIPEAQKQVRLIKAFDLRSKDAGLQKLALLLGDVIAQKSKGNLAYRLAEIYFYDLKDYQLAAEQYRYTLSVDLEEKLCPSAWFKIAQSYELLAFREGDKDAKWKEYLNKAIEVYDSLTVLYPSGELADQAIVTAFKLRLQLAEKAEDVQRIGTEFLSRSSETRVRDVALLALGDTYLSAKSYENAVLTYKLLLEKYPDRETVPTAQYQLGMALDGLGMKDSTLQLFDQFLKKNPNHPKSASAAEYLAQSAADKGKLSEALRYFEILESRYFYHPIRSHLDIFKGDAYFACSNFTEAVKLYEKAWDRFQTDFFIITVYPEVERSIIIRLADCYEKLGNRASAKKWYTEYVMRDNETEKAGHAFYALASIAKEENQVELAAKYLQNVSRITTKTGGKSLAVALETAEMLFQDEKYSDAITEYIKAVTQTKNDTAQQYIQSRIVVSYYRLDNFKEADKRAAEFVKTYPRASDYAAEFEFEKGKYLLRKEDLSKALGQFYKVVRSYPKAPVVPEALFWTARAYELDQKPQLAVRLYDSLLQHFPNDKILPRVRLSLGNAYYNLEQWDAASKQYRTILDNEQRSPELVPSAMSNLIMVYKEMGLFDAALEITRRYIDRFPNEPDLIDKKIDIGVLYQKLGYYDQSVLQLQSLIDAGNPDLEAELRYYIGEAYFYKGDYQQAILEFLKVPYLVTKRGKVDWISSSYYMAGQSYEKTSKYDEAITMYKQIIDRKDTDAQFKAAAQKEIDRVRLIVGKKE